MLYAVRLLGVLLLLARYHNRPATGLSGHSGRFRPRPQECVPSFAQRAVEQLTDGRDLACLRPLDQHSCHGVDIRFHNALKQRGAQIRHALGIGVPRPARVALSESTSDGAAVW